MLLPGLTWPTLALAYLFIINLIGFVIMGVDKKKAIRGAYRIPEATLFIIALLGGSIGSVLGMYTFHHKTKHWYFVVGMPAIFIVEALLAIVICFL